MKSGNKKKILENDIIVKVEHCHKDKHLFDDYFSQGRIISIENDKDIIWIKRTPKSTPEGYPFNIIKFFNPDLNYLYDNSKKLNPYWYSYISKELYYLYQKEGYIAVVNYCNGVGFPYKYCKGCETSMPYIVSIEDQKQCCICGSTVI